MDLFDYRPQKPTDPALDVPERTREVLHPNSETLWADLCLVNVNSGGKLTDLQALEIEARILVRLSLFYHRTLLISTLVGYICTFVSRSGPSPHSNCK